VPVVQLLVANACDCERTKEVWVASMDRSWRIKKVDSHWCELGEERKSDKYVEKIKKKKKKASCCE